MARRKAKAERPSGSAAEGLPPELATTLHQFLGDGLPVLERALSNAPPVSIRINPAKRFEPGGRPVPWCATGRYLEQRPAFTFDPMLHAGAYYVQEASSMLLEQAVLATDLAGRDILALDLCAAPGGKSTHLRSLLSSDSLLVANEIEPKRWPALMENLWKWGTGDVIITGSASEDLRALPDLFDLIVVDAPCSGEGMFRKDPFAREQWSPRLVVQCASTQTRIVDHAWQALAPGGVLIYSTCTWEPAENEEQLLPLVDKGAIPVEIPVDPEWGFVPSGVAGLYGLRAFPHKVEGEGFFMAVLKKPGTPPARHTRPLHREQGGPLPFLDPQRPSHHTERNGVQHVVAERWGAVAETIYSQLRTLAPGIPVAERKGDKWIPHPALALHSELLKKEGFELLELAPEQALSYLKGNSLTASGASGTALATYKGYHMGWLNGAGNRWNNRWPPAWRIRSHAPAMGSVPW